MSIEGDAAKEPAYRTVSAEEGHDIALRYALTAVNNLREFTHQYTTQHHGPEYDFEPEEFRKAMPDDVEVKRLAQFYLTLFNRRGLISLIRGHISSFLVSTN